MMLIWATQEWVSILSFLLSSGILCHLFFCGCERIAPLHPDKLEETGITLACSPSCLWRHCSRCVTLLWWPHFLCTQEAEKEQEVGPDGETGSSQKMANTRKDTWLSSVSYHCLWFFLLLIYHLLTNNALKIKTWVQPLQIVCLKLFGLSNKWWEITRGSEWELYNSFTQTWRFKLANISSRLF